MRPEQVESELPAWQVEMLLAGRDASEQEQAPRDLTRSPFELHPDDDFSYL